MYIHWVLELVLKCFDFGSLVEKLLLLEADLGFEFINTSDLGVNGEILVSESG